jgi:hypothetical protein
VLEGKPCGACEPPAERAARVLSFGEGGRPAGEDAASGGTRAEEKVLGRQGCEGHDSASGKRRAVHKIRRR